MIEEIRIEASELQPGDTVIEFNGNKGAFDIVLVSNAGFNINLLCETIKGRYWMVANPFMSATVLR